MSQLDLGACFGEADRLDEPMTREQFLQQTPARCADVPPVGHSVDGVDPLVCHTALVSHHEDQTHEHTAWNVGSIAGRQTRSEAWHARQFASG